MDTEVEYLGTAHTIHHYFLIGAFSYTWEIHVGEGFTEKNTVKRMDNGDWKVLNKQLTEEMILRFLKIAKR